MHLGSHCNFKCAPGVADTEMLHGFAGGWGLCPGTLYGEGPQEEEGPGLGPRESLASSLPKVRLVFIP